jgi:hypothetical protein
MQLSANTTIKKHSPSLAFHPLLNTGITSVYIGRACTKYWQSCSAALLIKTVDYKFFFYPCGQTGSLMRDLEQGCFLAEAIRVLGACASELLHKVLCEPETNLKEGSPPVHHHNEKHFSSLGLFNNVP